MATKFAMAVRHRTLLLPWNFNWRFNNYSKPYSGNPASGVAYQILNAVDQWPVEADQLMDYYILYSTPADYGLCYYCKALTKQKGLHFACEQCKPADSFTYFRVYCDALHFASKQWDLSIRTAAEENLIRRLELAKMQSSINLKTSNLAQSEKTESENSGPLEETTVQRLKRLLAARLTKPTGD